MKSSITVPQTPDNTAAALDILKAEGIDRRWLGDAEGDFERGQWEYPLIGTYEESVIIARDQDGEPWQLDAWMNRGTSTIDQHLAYAARIIRGALIVNQLNAAAA